MSTHRKWLIALAIAIFPAAASGQGTAFSYQGQLKQSGSPADGSFNLTFKLFDAVTAGTQQGSTLTFDGAGGNPAPVSVANGLFTVSLDFGVGPFTANQARWLEIAVSGTTLSPRQALTPTPFALNTRGLNVDASGRVGVGTATPAQKLSVVGTVQSTAGGFMFPDNTVQTTAAMIGPGFWTSSGTNIFNNNTGFVGIGTNAPQAKLDLRGNLVLDTGGDAAILTGTGSTEQNRYLSLFNSLAFTSASGLRAGGILCSDNYFFANPGKNDLIVKGSVGVGVATPTARLQVGGSGMTPFGIFCDSNSADPGANAIRGVISNVNFGGAFSCGVFGGNVANNGGFGVFGNHASGGTGVRGDSVSGSGVVGTTQGASGYGGYFNNTAGDGVFGQSAGSGKSGIVGISTHANGYGAYFQNNAGGIAMRCNGRASVGVLEITGADVAERFPSTDEKVAPGTVMEIDPDHMGKLRVARGEYSLFVAGVVSGAGDIPVGAILGNLPGQESEPTIALSGRVWVKCDASDHAIALGDLLTTCTAPGYAMSAVDRERRSGATIGKAMTTLKKGERGLVLVLVNLQ